MIFTLIGLVLFVAIVLLCGGVLCEERIAPRRLCRKLGQMGCV